jgi:hypothetical protein
MFPPLMTSLTPLQIRDFRYWGVWRALTIASGARVPNKIQIPLQVGLFSAKLWRQWKSPATHPTR